MRAAHEQQDYFDPAGIKLISLIWFWRRFILINLFMVMVVAAAVSLFMPNWYRATATILPPKDDSSMLPRGAMDLLVGLGPVGFGATGLGATESQQLSAVLRSRSLADVVIARENLVEHYDLDTLPEARREFIDLFSVEIDADGLVTVRMPDKDPYKAAAIINTSLATLDSINQNLSTSSARATRQFVESRLTEVELELRATEDSLRLFQEDFGTIALEEQLAVIIQNLAMLRVERMKHEMNLAILEERLGSDHARLQAAKQKIETVDRQIRAAESTGDSAASLTAGNAPRLAMESVRMLRQVAVYEQMYQFLRQALEQSKIDEQRDIPTFTVLDQAIPPDRKWKPKRTFIVLGSGALAFILMTLLLAWTETTRAVHGMKPVGYGDGWKRVLNQDKVQTEEHVG
jgi:tyrosine-protein kinase Etk/Wzc